jgi:hypothetical protein
MNTISSNGSVDSLPREPEPLYFLFYISSFLSSISKGQHTVQVQRAHGTEAGRVSSPFSDAVEKWKVCLQRAGAIEHERASRVGERLI